MVFRSLLVIFLEESKGGIITIRSVALLSSFIIKYVSQISLSSYIYLRLYGFTGQRCLPDHEGKGNELILHRKVSGSESRSDILHSLRKLPKYFIALSDYCTVKIINAYSFMYDVAGNEGIAPNDNLYRMKGPF